MTKLSRATRAVLARLPRQQSTAYPFGYHQGRPAAQRAPKVRARSITERNVTAFMTWVADNKQWGK